MLTFLLIEDDLLFRQMFKAMLANHFPDVLITEAGSCKEALDSIEMQLPDLIFSDIRLPDSNGLALISVIKPQYPDISIIILSLSDYPEYRNEAKELGVDLFLSKNKLNQKRVLQQIDLILKTNELS